MGNYKKKKNHQDHLEAPEFITPVQRLMDIINNRMDARTSHPAMMPERQQEAAEWWITKQEPMGDNEKAGLDWTIPKKATDVRKQYWKTPYADRLTDTLIIFYKLNHAEQMYILDLHSQGIWWRGDSIEFMKKLEKVTPEMVADKVKLRAMLHKMVGKMGMPA